jgi:mRNA interferase MazF
MKDFANWNIKKQKADSIAIRPMFKEREIWWCSLGVNIGDEQDGKGHSFVRPVLVFKKFNKNIFIGIPLSTRIKENSFYYRFTFLGKEQSLLISQLKLLDAKRFGNKMGELTSHEMENIKTRIKNMML